MRVSISTTKLTSGEKARVWDGVGGQGGHAGQGGGMAAEAVHHALHGPPKVTLEKILTINVILERILLHRFPTRCDRSNNLGKICFHSENVNVYKAFAF